MKVKGKCKCGCGATTTHYRGKFQNYVSGHNKPMLGKRHSKKTKEKISKKLKGKPLSKETKQKMLGRTSWLKGKPLPKYIREKLSKIVTNKIISGKLVGNYSYRKYGKFYSKKNRRYIRYESSYELKACKKFELDKSIKNYGRCNRDIKYYLNNYRHRYLPDYELIYKNGDKEIVEIKPKSQVKKPKNVSKFKAAKLFCKKNHLSFKILTEVSL